MAKDKGKDKGEDANGFERARRELEAARDEHRAAMEAAHREMRAAMEAAHREMREAMEAARAEIEAAHAELRAEMARVRREQAAIRTGPLPGGKGRGGKGSWWDPFLRARGRPPNPRPGRPRRDDGGEPAPVTNRPKPSPTQGGAEAPVE